MRTTQARVKCLTCQKSWHDKNALEEAENHAATHHHKVKGIQQTVLETDHTEGDTK